MCNIESERVYVNLCTGLGMKLEVLDLVLTFEVQTSSFIPRLELESFGCQVVKCQYQHIRP